MSGIGGPDRRKETFVSGIFKPYDIRGIYGETLSEELAFLIGHALVDFLNRDEAKRRKVVVGRDMRSHSATLADALAGELDGMSVEFGDWWFNVRTSNTEPVMRLNVEAKTLALMDRKRDDVLKIMRRE